MGYYLAGFKRKLLLTSKEIYETSLSAGKEARLAVARKFYFMLLVENRIEGRMLSVLKFDLFVDI